MRIEHEIKLDYNDVLIRPKRSTLGSRKEVDLSRGYSFRNYFKKTNEPTAEYGYPAIPKHWRGIPIMASNMDGVGTFQMADALASQNIMTCLVKTYSVEDLITFFDSIENDDGHRTDYVAMSIGITPPDEEKFKNVYTEVGERLKFVCIDVANGYSERFTDFVRNFRKSYPNVVIIAGNVVTADQTQELLLNGADIIKVGIGPGSVCTTRIQTGVGYPQLSAVMECADAAHGLGGHIIADGGCNCPGDVAKAFAGGADYVMLGGMLAGHDEGETQLKDGKRYFYGMSSQSAFDTHGARKDGYRGTEGKTVILDDKGPVKDTVEQLLGGIRSTCTYIGARRVKDMPKCAHFVCVNNVINRVFDKYEK